MIPIRWLSLTACVLGLIQREDGSMEKELEELRRSRPKPPVGGDFTLCDCFYFTRRGIESIVEDEVHFYFINKNTVCNINGNMWFIITGFAFQTLSGLVTVVWFLISFIFKFRWHSGSRPRSWCPGTYWLAPTMISSTSVWSWLLSMASASLWDTASSPLSGTQILNFIQYNTALQPRQK